MDGGIGGIGEPTQPSNGVYSDGTMYWVEYCKECRWGYPDTMYFPCKHTSTYVLHQKQNHRLGVCGMCSSIADMLSYRRGTACSRPVCPECKQAVTHRVKIDVQFYRTDRDYVEQCGGFDDVVHQLVHGRWCNLSLRFRVSYPLISSPSAVKRYRSMTEDERKAVSYRFYDMWFHGRRGVRTEMLDSAGAWIKK